MPVPTSEVSIRPMEPADERQVLALVEIALGHRRDARNAAFFAWKHRENAFGVSPAWVALDGDQVVGFRTLMRWEFATRTGPARAVRAVDTATHPDHQGRGIFSALTRRAVDELRPDGVDFVFNTPNDKSRPGYLKMGWQPVGRLQAGLRPASVPALQRIANARVPAEIWSIPSHAGVPPQEVLSDDKAVSRLLDAVLWPAGVVTRRTPAYLRWRYGFVPLAYRALLAGIRRRGRVAAVPPSPPGPGDRTRRRRSTASRFRARGGPPVGSRGAPGIGRRLRAWARTTPASGLLPLPGQGPMLTWRPLAADSMPPLGDWRLSLGDIELF